MVTVPSVLSYPVPVVLVVIQIDILLVVQQFVAADDHISFPSEPIGDAYAGHEFRAHPIRVFDVHRLVGAHVVILAGHDELVVVVHEIEVDTYIKPRVRVCIA